MENDKCNFVLGVLQYLKNKEVEIYCGDSKETLNFNDHDLRQKSLIRGTLIDGVGETLIVKVSKKNKEANVFISIWSVVSIIEYEKGGLRTCDIFESEEY